MSSSALIFVLFNIANSALINNAGTVVAPSNPVPSVAMLAPRFNQMLAVCRTVLTVTVILPALSTLPAILLLI